MRYQSAIPMAVATVAAAVVLCGCQSNGGNGNISPMQHPMLENVPIPRGFQIVDHRSRSGSTASGQRWARCTFSGNLERGSVVRFYTDNMPTARWEERERRFENGVFEIRYENPIGEACVVYIRKGLFATEIEIDLKQRAERGGSQPPPP